MKNKEDKVVVAVSGYFDPLHIGHLEFFKLAKALGDELVVIVNNDEQAIAKKGSVFMSQEDRKAIVEAIKYVDKAIICIDKDSSTCKTLEILKPNILANGGDRAINAEGLPEIEVCKKYSIKIVDGLGKKIRSSSEMIENSKTQEE